MNDAAREMKAWCDFEAWARSHRGLVLNCVRMTTAGSEYPVRGVFFRVGDLRHLGASHRPPECFVLIGELWRQYSEAELKGET